MSPKERKKKSRFTFRCIDYFIYTGLLFDISTAKKSWTEFQGLSTTNKHGVAMFHVCSVVRNCQNKKKPSRFIEISRSGSEVVLPDLSSRGSTCTASSGALLSLSLPTADWSMGRSPFAPSKNKINKEERGDFHSHAQLNMWFSLWRDLSNHMNTTLIHFDKEIVVGREGEKKDLPELATALNYVFFFADIFYFW